MTATVTPGKQFAQNEAVDNDKLNQLGTPTIAIAGDVADLDDVTAPTPANGDFLTYVSSTGKWTAGKTEFTGASAGADGVAGLVEKPVIGDQVKFLRGDATWQVVPAPWDYDLVDGDLEIAVSGALTYWTMTNLDGTGSLVTGAGEFNTGAQGWKATGGSSTGARILSRNIRVQPAACIAIGWSMKTNSSSTQVEVALLWYKGDGTASATASTVLFAAGTATPGSTWTPYKKAVIVPTDAYYCAVRITAAQTGGDAYVDSISFQRVADYAGETALNNISSTMVTFAHKLGIVPSRLDWVMICTDTNLGYAAGDSARPASYISSMQNIHLFADAANVYVKNTTSIVDLMQKAGTTAANVTTTKWTFRIYAWA